MSQRERQIFDALGKGEAQAARDLLPLVYDELRRLAAQRLAHEKPGHMLQATALVHEAYLRIVGPDAGKHGAVAATSSPQRPRPCGGFWSKTLDGNPVKNMAATSIVASLIPRRSPRPRLLTTLSLWTRPLISFPGSTLRSPNL